MPGFTNPQLEQATHPNALAARLFVLGRTRERPRTYTCDTVLLAAVLVLVATAQRFTVRGCGLPRTL